MDADLLALEVAELLATSDSRDTKSFGRAFLQHSSSLSPPRASPPTSLSPYRQTMAAGAAPLEESIIVSEPTPARPTSPHESPDVSPGPTDAALVAELRARIDKLESELAVERNRSATWSALLTEAEAEREAALRRAEHSEARVAELEAAVDAEDHDESGATPGPRRAAEGEALDALEARLAKQIDMLSSP